MINLKRNSSQIRIFTMERTMRSIENNHVREIEFLMERVDDHSFHIRDTKSGKFLTLDSSSRSVYWKDRPETWFYCTERIVTGMNGNFLRYDSENNVLTQFNPDDDMFFLCAFFLDVPAGGEAPCSSKPTAEVMELSSDSDTESEADSALEDLERQLGEDLDKERVDNAPEQRVYEFVDTLLQTDPGEEIVDDVPVKKKKPRKQYKPRKPKDVTTTEPKPKRERCKGLRAYSAFQKDKRASVIKNNPGLTFAEVSRKMGQLWKLLPREEKLKWFSMQENNVQ